jgi:hypothetical protein
LMCLIIFGGEYKIWSSLLRNLILLWLCISQFICFDMHFIGWIKSIFDKDKPIPVDLIAIFNYKNG